MNPHPIKVLTWSKERSRIIFHRSVRLWILPVLAFELSFPLSRTVPRGEMTRYNGSGSRLNVPDGPDYTIWLVNSTRIGFQIIKKISILSWFS